MNSRNVSFFAALALASSAFAGTTNPTTSVTSRHFASLTSPVLFAALDLDHDGVLSATEQAYAAITLSALDVDGDGVISATELAGPARTRPSRRGANAVVQSVAYRPVSDLNLLIQLDANQDGILQAFELANAASSLRELDSNRDGVLTRSEVVLRVQA